MGKNLSLLLNAILIIAIIPLYLLHFSGSEGASGPDSGKKDSLSTAADSTASAEDSMSPYDGNLKVAYVNWDTLMNEYDYVEDMMSELEKEKIRMRKEMEKKMRNFQQEAQKLKKESTYMTQDELKKAQKRIQRKQQNLRKEQQGIQSRLTRKRQKMLKKFFDNVNNYLEKYNEENEIDLILRYQRGGDVLFAENGFDITQKVLKGLNQKYKKEGADKEVPEVSDTTSSPLPSDQKTPLAP